MASSDGARLRPCFGLSGDIGSAPLANGLNILHMMLTWDTSVCYVLAVGLYMISFDRGFADDLIGGSRQAGAIIGCWIASRISVFSKLEFPRPGKLLCLCADRSGLLCSQLAGCGKLMHIGPERYVTKSQKLEKNTY